MKNGITILLFSIFVICPSITIGINSTIDLQSEPIQLEMGVSSVRINLTHQDWSFTTINLEGKTYHRLNTNSTGIVGEEGGPALPAYSKWIEIPEGMIPSLIINSGAKNTYHDLNIAPFTTLTDDNPKLAKNKPINSDLYSRDALFPPDIASLSPIITLAGRRFASLDLTPYQYNPVTKELVVTNDISVEVVFENDPTPLSILTKFNAPAYRELHNAFSKQPSRDEGTKRVDNLGRYLIIHPNNDDVIESLQPLVEWKERKGHPVSMVSLQDAGNSPEQIRNFILQAFQEWEDPPVFILLAGDNAGQDMTIPFFRHEQYGQPNTGWHASDNQYGTWIGEQGPDLWIPEGFVGRLPYSSIQELNTMVAKIISYEMTPFMGQSWVQGGVLIANGVHSCISTNIAIRELMQGVGYNRDNIHEAYSEYHLGQRPDFTPVQNRIFL